MFFTCCDSVAALALANCNEHVAEANITAPAHTKRALHGAQSSRGKSGKITLIFSSEYTQRRSTLLLNRDALQTTAPSGLGDERERLVTASPVMTKSRSPAGENIYPENGLVKPPRRDTRAFSPAGMSGERRRLAKWRRRADCTRHQCPCAVRLFTFFANGEYKLD